MRWMLHNYYLDVEFTSLGGALSSIKTMDGTEYLWQGDAANWSGQSPVLFPICGSLRGDTAQLADGGSVNMPFFLGGHPGFRCPILEGESFEDYQLKFEKEEQLSISEADTKTGLVHMGHRRMLLNHTGRLPLTHQLFYEDALTLDGLASRKIRLCYKSDKRGVEIKYQDFPYLVLWSTANDGPFVVIEPWSGLSTCDDEDDVFEHKRGLLKAAPGELKQLSFSIEIL